MGHANFLRHTLAVGFLVPATLFIAVTAALGQFVHPGVAHSGESIALVKEKVKSGQQPWLKAWERLRSTDHASLDYRPNPHARVERGPSNDPDIGSTDFSMDGVAAYVHALAWNLTDDKRHAMKAAEILDSWSAELKEIGNHDARLLVGMSGYHYCIAAELLKHTWDGWSKKGQKQFEQMIRKVWLPIIHDFYPSANGNWDASMLQAMAAMGVVLDDKEVFDRATEYYLKGKGNGAIGNYFKATGQCQETGRDQAHTQMGLEFLANTCETAWIQGVDLYGALDSRLLKGFEYTARYNLGEEVPYEPYKSFEGRYHYKKISDNSRGRFRPMYHRVLNHYQKRQGLTATFTRRAANQQRPRRRIIARAFIDELMYSEPPKK